MTATSRPGPPPPPRQEPLPHLLTWSAPDARAEQDMRRSLARLLASGPPGRDLGALASAWTAPVSRGPIPAGTVRAGLVAATASEALRLLDEGRYERRDPAPRPTVVHLFSALSPRSRWWSAGLFAQVPGARQAAAEAGAELRRAGVFLPPVTDPAGPDEAGRPAAGAALARDFAVGYAVGRLLGRWGIRPALVALHGGGLLAPLVLAGVVTLPDAAAALAGLQAELEHAPPGGMLAVAAGAAAVTALLPPGAGLAADNGPDQVVVSADEAVLEVVRRRAADAGLVSVLLPVPSPLHGPAMWPAVRRLARRWADLPVRRPGVGLVSTAWPAGAQFPWPGPSVPPGPGSPGRPGPAGRSLAPWASDLAVPLRLWPVLGLLARQPGTVVLECGGTGAAAAIGRRHPGFAARAAVLSSLPSRPAGPSADRQALLRAVAQLWTAGAGVDLPAVTASLGTGTGADPREP